MPQQAKHYGWIPDLPDHRDWKYAAPARVLADLPSRVDLRDYCPEVLDQGELGSCTANAIANAHLFDQMAQQAKHPMPPSRLFIYFNERWTEGTVQSDSGAQIRTGIKTIADYGVCSEKRWPYVIGKFAKRPPKGAFTEALKHQSVTYRRIEQTLNDMRGCLAAGHPFVFGFTVYDAFESPTVARTGVLNMPGKGERCRGGHAVLAVGYDNASARFLVMNSWGDGWGDDGFFTIPYAYLLDSNLAADFWVVSTVETT